MDENRRCKPQYSKELRQIHPQLKCLSRGAVDTGPISDPPIVWTTGQRMAGVDANACFQGSFERLSVVQPCWTTGQRMILPGIHKKAPCVCVCRGAMQSIFVPAVVPVDRASRPLGEMAGRVVGEAKTPIFIVVYGPRPSPPNPLFWWRGGSGCQFDLAAT